jgi:hypothetical protein
MGRWLLRACGHYGKRGRRCRKTAQGSVACQLEGTQLHAGLLVIENGHENERTWPL